MHLQSIVAPLLLFSMAVLATPIPPDTPSESSEASSVAKRQAPTSYFSVLNNFQRILVAMASRFKDLAQVAADAGQNVGDIAVGEDLKVKRQESELNPIFYNFPVGFFELDNAGQEIGNTAEEILPNVLKARSLRTTRKPRGTQNPLWLVDDFEDIEDDVGQGVSYRAQGALCQTFKTKRQNTPVISNLQAILDTALYHILATT